MPDNICDLSSSSYKVNVEGDGTYMIYNTYNLGKMVKRD